VKSGLTAIRGVNGEREFDSERGDDSESISTHCRLV
jgi:hypothetical protein